MRTSQFMFIALLLNVWITGCSAQIKNGFDLRESLVPSGHILRGGPAKNGIPAIDEPRFVAADQARFLRADDSVLGIDYRGISKAYPVNILNWHEIVNDRFNGAPVVITFCPLCGSGMAYSAVIDGKPHSFGVSGLLYNSDVLLYDRQTESLWSQLMSQAISGPHKGKRLDSLPLRHTTWQDWRTRHPGTLVLSTDTGFKRDYRYSPYARYIESPQIMFPVTAVSKRFHPKEEVLGLEIGGQFKAYLFIELEKSADSFTETLGGQSITLRYDRRHRSAAAYDEQGKLLPGVWTFWFAWYAFHPKTEVFTAAKP
ncbi:MAG: DUF3179 domain-containing protein [Gammaproteobacteria bacterium]